MDCDLLCMGVLEEPRKQEEVTNRAPVWPQAV